MFLHWLYFKLLAKTECLKFWTLQVAWWKRGILFSKTQKKIIKALMQWENSVCIFQPALIRMSKMSRLQLSWIVVKFSMTGDTYDRNYSKPSWNKSYTACFLRFKLVKHPHFKTVDAMPKCSLSGNNFEEGVKLADAKRVFISKYSTLYCIYFWVFNSLKIATVAAFLLWLRIRRRGGSLFQVDQR